MALPFLLYKTNLEKNAFFFLFHLQDLKSKAAQEKQKSKNTMKNWSDKSKINGISGCIPEQQE